MTPLDFKGLHFMIPSSYLINTYLNFKQVFVLFEFQSFSYFYIIYIQRYKNTYKLITKKYIWKKLFDELFEASFEFKGVFCWIYKFNWVNFFLFKVCSIATYFSSKIGHNLLIIMLCFKILRLIWWIKRSTTTESFVIFTQYSMLWQRIWDIFLFLSLKIFFNFVKLYFIWVQFFVRFVLISIAYTSETMRLLLIFEVLCQWIFCMKLNFIQTFEF